MISLINALPGAVAQGLIWGVMAIGVYLTFRILDIADLTVDALFCRRDAAIAIDVHASPFWLKDNERHF